MALPCTPSARRPARPARVPPSLLEPELPPQPPHIHRRHVRRPPAIHPLELVQKLPYACPPGLGLDRRSRRLPAGCGGRHVQPPPVVAGDVLLERALQLGVLGEEDRLPFIRRAFSGHSGSASVSKAAAAESISYTSVVASSGSPSVFARRGNDSSGFCAATRYSARNQLARLRASGASPPGALPSRKAVIFASPSRASGG